MHRLSTGKQPQLPAIQRVKSLTDISTVPSVTFSTTIHRKSSSSLPTSAPTTGDTTPSSTSISPSSQTLSSMTPSTSSQQNPTGVQSTAYMTQSTKTPAGMPAWGEKGSPPKFRGSYEDVKRFLQRYNEVTSIYNLSHMQKCDKVTDYCSRKVKRLIESLKSYTSKDWDQLEKDFLKYYDADRQETRYIIRDLTQLTKKWKQRSIKTLTRWKRYERKFMTIAGWLVEKKKINEDEKSAYFWHGINRSLRRDIENRLLMRSPQPQVTVPYDMDDVNEVVQQLFERDRFEYNLADSDSDLPDSEDLSSDSSSEDTDSSDSEWEERKSSNKYKHTKSKKKHRRRDSDSDSDEEYDKHKRAKSKKKKLLHKKSSPKEVKKPSTAVPTSSTTSSKTSGQPDVEQLIKQMGKLSINDPQYGLLYYKATKIDPGVAQCVAAPKVQGLINTSRNVNSTYPNSIPLANTSTQSSFIPRPPMTCYGCGQTGHGLRTCEAIQEMIDNGSIVRDQFGRITFRDGTPVQREPGETIKQAATRRQTMHSHFIQLSDMTEYYQSDDEDCEVMAAEREPKSINKARKLVFDGVGVPRPPWKGKENVPPQSTPTQEIMNKVGPKTRSQGPAPESAAPQPILRPNAPEEFKSIPMDIRQPRRVQIKDVEMKDVQHKAPAQPAKPKPLPRQSQVSTQVGEFQVVNNILNTPVTMKVGEVLASSKELSQQLTEMIKQKNSKPPIPTNQTLMMARDRGLLIKIPLECGGRQVMAIIDTGSQLNVVSKEISDSIIKLPVNPNCEAVMRDANGGKGQLSGKVENVPLTCGAVQTKATLFVGDNVPFDLLLGRPWQRSNLVSIDERPQGTYLVFRNPRDTEIVHELLVEKQIPKLEYSFDVALDENQDSEEAEVGIITVADNSIPQITINEEHEPANLELCMEAASSEPAAVESEFETQKNVEDQHNSSDFSRGTYFYWSGTTPDLSGTIGAMNHIFLTSVNHFSSHVQWLKSEFQIWKSERGHAVSLPTPVNVLFWLTMVISYLRWFIVLLIRQVNSSRPIAYIFARGRTRKPFIPHNKQLQTMSIPASRSESVHLQNDGPLVNVSNNTQDSNCYLFANSNIIPADVEHHINLIERVNEAHLTSDARPVSSMITSPSTIQFPSQVYDGIHMEHGVLLNASMVFITSELDPPRAFRGNMAFQFFIHPNSPPQTPMTHSALNTPPPSRNSVRSPSPFISEVSNSIFNTGALPTSQMHNNQGLSSDGVDARPEKESAVDSCSSSGVCPDVHKLELQAASRCSSISDQFPNLVSPPVRAQKIQLADNENINKCPEGSSTLSPSSRASITSPLPYDLNSKVQDDVTIIQEASIPIISNKTASNKSSAVVYQVLAAVVDPLPSSEPPVHPHHRPIRIHHNPGTQSSIFCKKLAPIVIPPSKPIEVSSRGRRRATRSLESIPTSAGEGGTNVPVEQAFHASDRMSSPVMSDSKIRQEIHPGIASLISHDNPIPEKSHYSGEVVEPLAGTFEPLELTVTPHDKIPEPGNSVQDSRESPQSLSGLHLLAHAALVVEQQDRDTASCMPTTMPTVESAGNYSSNFLSSLHSRVTSSTMKKLISAMSDQSYGLMDNQSTGEDHLGAIEPGVYPRILTTVVESEEEKQPAFQNIPRTPTPNAVVNIQDGELIPFNRPLSTLEELEYLQSPSQPHEPDNVETIGNHSTITGTLQETILESTPLVEPLPLRFLLHEELLAGSETSDGGSPSNLPGTKSAIIQQPKPSQADNTTYHSDGIYESVHSLKRRREEGELEETHSNYGDISNHSPLVDEMGRIKRPRSETPSSSVSEEQAIYDDAWEIAVTAALEAERSSPTSSISTDIEAEWEEFQRELKEAINSSSSFSQSSPPPLISISDSDSEEMQIFIPHNKTISPAASLSTVVPPPMVPATDISAPIQSCLLPLDRQWYELKTDQPDVHGYSSASLYALRAHGYDIIPDLSSSEFSIPSGHPLWCLKNQYPILSMSTSRVYTGSDDNHPLVSWDNQLLPYEPNTDLTHGKFHGMAIPFIHACDILSTQKVCPEDWEGVPNTEYRREVRHRVWNAHMMQPGSHLFRNPFPAEPPHLLGQLHTFFGQQPSMLSHNYRTVADNPSTWKDRPMGASLNSDLSIRFASPYANEYDIVAFNAWNPRISKLREARAYILEGIKLTVSYLLNPRMRQLIDIYEDDLKHYFYHHCHLFRFIDPRKPPFAQGFTFECIHLDDYTIEFPPPPRKAQPPCNPLLSEEEDEFLHHVSRIFENLSKIELTNAIRRIRAVIPFMAEEARILFKAGYLDLLEQFDPQQVKYPLLWVTPELRL